MIAATYLLHGEGVHNFTSIVCQLGCLIGRYDGEKTGRGHFSWVGSEDAVDFFPDLQFGSFKTDC
jgi:hypothetical protein